MSIIEAIFSTRTQSRAVSGWDVLGDREYRNNEEGYPSRHVREETAMTYAPVWQAVSLISGDVAKLPLNHYRKSSDASRRIVIGETQQKVRWKSNAWQTAFQFWRLMVAQALLWRAAYAYINRDPDGTIQGLYPLWPGAMKVIHIPGSLDNGKGLAPESEIFYQYTDTDGSPRLLRYDQVLHISGVSILPTVGLSLVEYAGATIQLGLAAETFGLQFLKNAARPSGYVRMEGHIKDAAALERFMTTFRNNYAGAANSGKVPLLEDGAEFKPLSISQDEAQYAETRKAQVQDVARYFNLPPHKLGDDSRVSYNSLEQENQSYLDTCLSHWLNTIAAECFLKLIGHDEQKNGTEYFEHNTGALLRADINSRATAYRQFREMGVLSADDIAAKENLDPIGPDNGGDIRYVPAGWMRLGESTVKPDLAPAQEPTAEPPQRTADEAWIEAVSKHVKAAEEIDRLSGGDAVLPPVLPRPGIGGMDASGPVARLLEDAIGRHVRRIVRKSEVAAAKPKKYGEFVVSLPAERTLIYDDLAAVAEVAEALTITIDRWELADWTLGHAAEEYDRLQDTETADTLAAAVADLNTRLLRELPHEAAQMILEPAGEEL